MKFNRGFEFLHFHCGNFSGLNFVNLLKITNFGRFEKIGSVSGPVLLLDSISKNDKNEDKNTTFYLLYYPYGIGRIG